jgi:3',5'-cyclic AMP phosphodiesterase CpdA
VALLSLSLLLCSCAGFRFHASIPGDVETAPAYPPVRFFVLSDPHFYDAALGTEGPDFARYLERDRKLLEDSAELLTESLEMAVGADFLLIPGDLTKDGEHHDHSMVAAALRRLKARGVKTYVIPGNHDILNPESFSYTPRGRKRVPNVTPSEFAEIYKESGYGEALERDPASLSYVAEPTPGLWLLALDSCRYAENTGKSNPETSGGITPATLRWMRTVLAQGRDRGIGVIAMMHHGALQHFSTQKKYLPQYVLEGYAEFSRLIASYGVRVIFTGHNHAQDISLFRGASPGSFLYDVETASLVTHPHAIREVNISADQTLTIRSSMITRLPSFSEYGIDFASWSERFLRTGLKGTASRILARLGLSTADIEIAAPQIASAGIAHARGDEDLHGAEALSTEGLSPWGAFVVEQRRDFIESLWRDLLPMDNVLSIDLVTGDWKPAR